MGEKSTEAVAENIKLFIEVQDFLPSYDLVIWLIPHPLPRSHQQSRPATHRKTEEERQYAGRRVELVGEEPNHTTARKPGSLKIIQYSLHKTR